MMIDANRGATEETLRRLQAESYERFRLELFKSVEQLLADFEMTWDDLAHKINKNMSGTEVKFYVGGDIHDIDVRMINEIAAVFSAEPYIIFKPRLPWTGN